MIILVGAFVFLCHFITHKHTLLYLRIPVSQKFKRIEFVYHFRSVITSSFIHEWRIFEFSSVSSPLLERTIWEPRVELGIPSQEFLQRSVCIAWVFTLDIGSIRYSTTQRLYCLSEWKIMWYFCAVASFFSIWRVTIGFRFFVLSLQRDHIDEGERTFDRSKEGHRSVKGEEDVFL